MAPKSKKGAANAAKKQEDEHEEPLQAIVLADAHQTTFSPFSAQEPRCLLPLVGVPIIEYSLHALASAGVEEVYIVCGNYADELEDYIKKSKWKGASSPFSDLTVVRSSPFGTVGDVMRDMDKRAVMKNDFLVVYGDLVSNIPLEAALAAHQKRKAADKNAIMTMVLKESGAGPESRAEAPVFVIDPQKNRCLHYEDMSIDSEDHFIAMELDILAESNQFEVRADLIDCSIDICTPEVLALWSDNFDFQTPRQNFLYQVLKDYELNGKTIHTHIVDKHYAARVSNLKAYDSISKQIISRWTYPLCPDSNLFHNQTFKREKGHRYKDQKNVFLARTCTIGPKTVISADTRIGEGSVVTNSVIGRRCTIGRNVTIDNSYIWDDTYIKDGAVITQAIIADGCTVGTNSIIEAGALLSFGVQIADNITIKGTSRIACVKRKLSPDCDEIHNVPDNIAIVGQGGKGAEFIPHDLEDISSTHTQVSNLMYKLNTLSLSTESFSDPDEFSGQEESDDEDDFTSSSRPQPPSHRRSSTAESIFSNSSDHSTTRASRNAEADFHHEAVAGLVESLQRGDDASNVQLELTSLRMTANQSEHAVRRSLVTAFMRYISSLVSSPDGTLNKGYAETIKTTLTPYNTLFKRNVHDHDNDNKADQTDLLLLFQHDLSRRSDGDSLLMQTIMHFVLADVLQAEGVEQWWNSPKSVATEELKKVRAKTEPVVKQLCDDSSEEEDDDDDEDEDESD
jgi:translation initiation factor eIF-2B subunit epsilon